MENISCEFCLKMTYIKLHSVRLHFEQCLLFQYVKLPNISTSTIAVINISHSICAMHNYDMRNVIINLSNFLY